MTKLLLLTNVFPSGYRAGDVVPLPLDRLEALLRSSGALDAEASVAPPTHWMQAIFDAARRFDGHTISSTLHTEALNLGLTRFVRERAAPLITELGEAWTRGDLDIRHEHFISEIVQGTLRNLRGPLEAATRGRPVVLASLPNEHHRLGLDGVALAIAASGRAIKVLGPDLPPEEIVEAAIATNSVAVGLSVSAFSANEETSNQLATVREALPHRIRLWIGGAGASQLADLPADVSVVTTLDDLEHELNRLPDAV